MRETKDFNPWAGDTEDSVLQRRITRRRYSTPERGSLWSHASGSLGSEREDEDTNRQIDRFDTNREMLSASSSSSSIVDAESLGREALIELVHRLREQLDSLHDGKIHASDHLSAPTPTTRWTILHDVKCIHDATLVSYLDEPQLLYDRDLQHLHWHGQRRLRNVAAWERRQRIPFLITRQYECSYASTISSAVGEAVHSHRYTEKIHIRTSKLQNFLKSWLQANEGLAIYGRSQVYVDNTLTAPYLCFHHFGDEARQIVAGSERLASEASLLMEYLTSATEPTLTKANKMFSSGKINAELMPYLFRPGGIICFRESGSFVAYEQASPLKRERADPIARRTSYSCKLRGIVFDGQFWHVEKPRAEITIAAFGDQVVDIASLAVQPLEYTMKERRLSLKRRGEIFMSCRKRKYVTYAEQGISGENDLVGTPDFNIVKASTLTL